MRARETLQCSILTTTPDFLYDPRSVNEMSTRIDDMEKSLTDLIEKINEQVDTKSAEDN